MQRLLRHNRLLQSGLAAVMGAMAGAGCVTVQGGDKPIKVDMTVTFKVDQELDQFFAFERKYDPNTGTPATQPGTQPAATTTAP